MQTNDTPTEAHSDAERMSCPARLQEPEKHKLEKKLSRFFHTLAHKLKLSSSSEDDRESLLKRLGFGLAFVAVVQEPPQAHLFEDAAVCLERLDRVKDVFVRSKEEVKGVGTVVHVKVTLKPRKDAQVQGIFHPGKKDSRHWCWEQPPLMTAEALPQRGVANFKKIVLTNSLNYFIHLARSQYPAAPTTSSAVSVSTSSEDTSATTTSENHPDNSQQQQEPATAPHCQAQAELAILLHDFFQLQHHV